MIQEKQLEVHNKDEVINLVIDAIKQNKQTLVFVNSKRGAEKSAEDIAKAIKKEFNEEELENQIKSVLEEPTKQCLRLARCVKHSTAFHHSGLLAKQRKIIEENFLNNKIKVICATPTLALGVNLPAFRVIIKDIKRYTKDGMQYIPVFEYHQMSGRAGRPSKEKFGEAIIYSKNNDDNLLFQKYIFSDAENIYSKLAVEPILRKFILSLIDQSMNNLETIVDFFKDTFYGYQFKDMKKIKSIITKIIDFFEESEFLIKNKETYKLTKLGQRVNELYVDPLTGRFIKDSLNELEDMNVEEKTIALLYMASRCLELRPLPNLSKKEWFDLQEFIYKYETSFFEEFDVYADDYEDMLRAIKQTQILNDWINEAQEEDILEKYNIRPGELMAKLEIIKWIFHVIFELNVILKTKESNIIKKLETRIKYGCKEKLVKLIFIKNIGKKRARALFSNKVESYKDIINNKETSIRILGPKIYEKVTNSQISSKYFEKEKIKKPIKSKKKQSSLDSF